LASFDSRLNEDKLCYHRVRSHRSPEFDSLINNSHAKFFKSALKIQS